MAAMEDIPKVNALTERLITEARFFFGEDICSLYEDVEPPRTPDTEGEDPMEYGSEDILTDTDGTTDCAGITHIVFSITLNTIPFGYVPTTN